MNIINSSTRHQPLKERFRGFLPVIVDVETSGVDPFSHALLEIAAVMVEVNEEGLLAPTQALTEHVIPFENAVLDPQSLAFNGIDPFQPLRMAIEEREALTHLFTPIAKAVEAQGCQRAVLVGHNAWFDLLFVKAASTRAGITSPFHAFTCFDTATLSGLVYGQTVLAKALKAAGIAFDKKEAHSACYDAQKTAELFCTIINEYPWQKKPARKAGS